MNPPNLSDKVRNRRYVYAIVAGVEPPAVPLAGLFDEPVMLLSFQDISAIVSAVDVAALEPESAQLLRHEEVVETLMAGRSTLPVRFGAVFSNEEQVIATLASRYPGLKADLERLNGHVEIGLRILWDEQQVGRTLSAPPTPAWAENSPLPLSGRQRTPEGRDVAAGDNGPGKAYLLTRLQATNVERQLRQQAERLERRCRERLEPLAMEMTSRLLITKGTPVSAALLVSRAGLDALLAELNQFQAENQDLTMLCTGPWPPYNFIKGVQP